MDINSKTALVYHKSKIINKKFLNKIYIEFYSYFKNSKVPKGKLVELGSGGGFLKKIIPNVTTTDVISGPGIDLVVDATKMPFKNNSVSAFYMFDVFHHIKNPEKALFEMERCLVNNGKIIMIEPYVSLLSKIIYSYFHIEKHGFNPKGNWKIKGKGRMSDANPAIPWIIFVRDKERFQKKFPNLIATKIFSHTPLKYIISGGLTNYQLLPSIFYGVIDKLENFFKFTNKHTALFMTIEVTKINPK